MEKKANERGRERVKGVSKCEGADGWWKGDEAPEGRAERDVWRVVRERHLEWRMRKRRGSGKEKRPLRTPGPVYAGDGALLAGKSDEKAR